MGLGWSSQVEEGCKLKAWTNSTHSSKGALRAGVISHTQALEANLASKPLPCHSHT